MEEEQIPLTALERQRLIREITDDVLGHGPIQRFLDDPAVTEVMVNRFDQIYVERAGQLHLTDTSSARTTRCAGSSNGSSRA